MPFVLTTADSVRCPHSGTVQVAGADKLKIGGNAVLLVSGIAGHAVGGCKTPSPGKLCSTVLTATAGAATKLTVGGRPVALDTLAGTTDGLISAVVQLLLPTTAHQSKLTGK
jgi:hypothetical protein